MDRKVILEEKIISEETLEKVKSIEKEVYPDITTNNYVYDLNGLSVYSGNDWFIVFTKFNDNSTYIFNMAKKPLSDKSEASLQLNELMSTIHYLIDTSSYIEGDLKEDTAYLLFLMNKKLGYIEQVGKDTVFDITDLDTERVFTEDEQKEILSNIGNMKHSQKDRTVVHHVKFKKKINEKEKTVSK